MATKTNIRTMLETFSQTVSRKQIDETLIDAYYSSLSGYSDDQIKVAAFKCMDELKFFPKIPDVKERIILEKPDDEEDFIIKYGRKCVKCGHVGMCIREPVRDGEWECRQCYTGLTPEQFVSKMRKIHEAMSEMQAI